MKLGRDMANFLRIEAEQNARKQREMAEYLKSQHDRISSIDVECEVVSDKQKKLLYK
jgi:hypothetical protein